MSYLELCRIKAGPRCVCMCGLEGWGGAVTSYICIVWMCMPNGHLFQCWQVAPFFNKKYMTDPIFLDLYSRPHFSDIPVYAHIFPSEIF